MAMDAIAHHEVQLRQGQGRLALEVVDPAHRALADDEFGLVEEPVGGRSVGFGAAGHVQASHLDAAIGRAAHIQHRTVDEQLLEAQAPDRGGRQAGLHQGQAKRLPAGRVEQAHVDEADGGRQAPHRQRQPGRRWTMVGADVAHLDRYPQLRCGPAFQVRAPVADSRHNPAVKRPPGEYEQRPDSDNQPQQKSGQCRKGLEGTRGSRASQGFGIRCRVRCIHVHCKL